MWMIFGVLVFVLYFLFYVNVFEIDFSFVNILLKYDMNSVYWFYWILLMIVELYYVDFVQDDIDYLKEC